jgi:hypothetical protein
MKDPVRWRDDHSGTEAELRALLASSEPEAPSKSERERIWAGLAPQIQILPVPPPVIPLAPAAATGAAALVGKVTLGVVLVTAVGAGVHVARSRQPSAAPARSFLPPKEKPTSVLPTSEPALPVAPVPAPDKPVAHRPRPVAPVPVPAKAPEIRELPEVREAPAPVVVNNELLEEGRRLSRARTALRAHDPEAALKLLQSGPAGNAGLAQEREALTIEALWSRPPSRAEAEKRARAFMLAYPDSPYRARLKALVLGDR